MSRAKRKKKNRKEASSFIEKTAIDILEKSLRDTLRKTINQAMDELFASQQINIKL